MLEWPLSGFGDEIDPDPAVQAAVLLALGASHIEVRSAWGTNVSELETEQVARLKEILRRRRASRSRPSPAPSARWTSACRWSTSWHGSGRSSPWPRGWNQYIRIFSFYRAEGGSAEDIRDDVLARMGALAGARRGAGVVLLHENEKGIYGDTPSACWTSWNPWTRRRCASRGTTPTSSRWASSPTPTATPCCARTSSTSRSRTRSPPPVKWCPPARATANCDATIAALADGYTGFASLEPHLASAHELGGFSGPGGVRPGRAGVRGAHRRRGITLR